MSIIKDDAGVLDFTFWPIPGLLEGQTSAVRTFTIDDLPLENGTLYASEDDRIICWGRRTGIGSYQNLTTNPIDLSVLSGNIEFQTYVEALTPISGLERIPLSVVAGSSASAGWSN